MSPLDVAQAVPMTAAADFDRWLRDRGATERDVVMAIFKKTSGKQTVTLGELQEIALCHGWVDTQTRRIDAERYAIRFVPRRPGSHWSAKNRDIARRLQGEGRMSPAGVAALPLDL